MDELIAELEAQEQRLVFDRFDNDDAWAVGSRLVELGRERGLAITVDVRRGGQQLVVERLHTSSFLVGRRLQAGGRTFDASYGVDPADYATHGGAFPVRVRNVGVVGVVTVSGLPQADDHALVVEVLGSFLERLS
jgi:uncharacterized protein (UPF0303 family)